MALRTIFGVLTLAGISFGGSADWQVTHSLRSRSLPSTTIELVVSGVQTTPARDGFSAVSVDGLQSFAEPGNPGLPQGGKLIVVPSGVTPHLTWSVDTTSSHQAFPMPFVRRYRCDMGRAEEFSFNHQGYAKSEVGPWVSLQNLGLLGDAQVFRVAFRPVQWDAKNRSLLVAEKVTATIEYEGTAKRKAISAPLRQLQQAIAVNDLAASYVVGPEQMVLVVADEFKDEIQGFVKWKETRGLSVKVVTYSEAGGSNTAVQTYLKNLYGTAAVKPTYLLFVGNKTSLPGFMENTSSGKAASDYRYSLLSGEDSIPDIFYGRFLVDNASDLRTQVERSITYEKEAISATWYPQATTIASKDCMPSCDTESAAKVQAALKAGTYRQVDSFSQKSGTASPSNITTALNEGRTWLSYFGHGSGTSWGSTNGSFDNSSVESLSNSGKLPIVIDVACLNASWVNVSRCFGKTWVTHQSGGQAAGAVAFYGGSVSISWDPPAIMSIGISKTHFEKQLHSLGATVFGGQLYLIEQLGSGESSLENLRWYNLFGDPSLTVRTDTPKQYEAYYSYGVHRDRLSVGAELVDMQGAPISGATASVFDGQKLLGSGQTGSDGRVIVELADGALPNGGVLTLSGYNLLTKQVVLPGSF